MEYPHNLESRHQNPSKSIDISHGFAHRTERILNMNHISSDTMIFSLENEKVGVLQYQLREVQGETVCEIAMFGTQNGINSGLFQELQLLDSPKIKKQGLSYNMMKQFIKTICVPKGVSRIYVSPDVGLKSFWNKEIGEGLIKNGLIKRKYSTGFEICYEI